jgi:hypothetical protein
MNGIGTRSELEPRHPERSGGLANTKQSQSRTIPTLRALHERENASPGASDASDGTFLPAVPVGRVLGPSTPPA